MGMSRVIFLYYIMALFLQCSSVTYNEETNVTETNKNETVEAWMVKCPSKCHCNMGLIPHSSSSLNLNVQKQMKIVNCTNAGFVTTPKKVPLDTEVLLLSDNNFRELRKLPYIPGLLYIDLSNSSITGVLDKFLFSYFKKVQFLSLCGNKITKVTQGSFREMSSLIHLDLSLNNIVEISPDSFAGLSNLLQLDLHGNLLQHLDYSWFQDVFNLRQLILSSNLLRMVGNKDLHALTELNLLNLSDNLIRTVENKAFKTLSNLLVLELGSNQMVKVPTKSLQNLKSLKKLTLDSNPIPKLQKHSFIDMNISSISISYMNKLSVIENGAFYNLCQLTAVHAHDNQKLIYIDSRAFQIVPKLKTLYIHNNQLTAISPFLMEIIPTLREIHFYQNPIRCDCNAFWIRELLLEAESKNFSIPFFNDSKSIKCDYPLNLTGMSMGDVDPSAFGRVCAPTTLPAFGENYTVSVGEELRLECHAFGVPEPILTWLLPNGSEVTNATKSDRMEILDSCTLIVRYLKTADSGTYGCKSDNGVGFDISSTRITVNNKPVRLILNTISSNYVALSWNGTMHTSMISDYQLHYRALQGNGNIQQPYTVISLQPYHYSYTVSNLNASSLYEFCMVYVYETEVYKVHCLKAKTKDLMSESNTLKKVISEKIIAGVCTALGLVLFLACMVTLVKKFKFHKEYDPPYDSDDSINIPLENVYQPLSTPLCSSRTSLLNVTTHKTSFDEY